MAGADVSVALIPRVVSVTVASAHADAPAGAPEERP